MSTTAFGLGSKYFALYEVAGVGIQWRTISQSPVEGDDFNLGLSMMMLIMDAAVYGVLTWYIEAVHPGKSSSCPGREHQSHVTNVSANIINKHSATRILPCLKLECCLSGRNVWTSAALVLSPAEVLLVRQRAHGDLGLALVWRQHYQAQRDGRGPGLCNGPAQNRYDRDPDVRCHVRCQLLSLSHHL